MAHQKLNAWLRNQVAIERDGGLCVRFELRHLTNGKYGLEVHTIDGGGECPTDDWYESSVANLIAAADSDGQAIGGTQTYAVVSFRKAKPERVSSRCVFRVDGGDSIDDDMSTGHVATKDDMFRQMARHNEALAKILIANVATTTSMNERVIRRLSDQNDSLQSKRMEQMEVTESLLSLRHERDLETEKARNHSEMMTDLVGELKVLAPVVVKKLTAGKGENGAAEIEANRLLLSKFAESLSTDQKTILASNLSTEQQIVLAELLQDANQ